MILFDIIEWRLLVVIEFDPNPFTYSRPVGAEDVIDRDKETKALVQLADAGHLVRISAPRRYGKTSLMAKVFDVAQREAEMETILVDLYRVESLADVAIRIERAYARQLRSGIRAKVAKLLEGTGLGLSLGPVGVSVQLANRSVDQALPLIHALLDLPRSAMEGTHRRALIVFDEFQDVLAVDGFDGVLRSHIQHHGDIATYFFTGSEPSLLRQLFEDRRRPLFEQAQPFVLDRLRDDDIASFVIERFDQTGRDTGGHAGNLAQAAEGHPQRAMLLANQLWERTPRGGTAGIDDWLGAVAAAREQVAPQFEAIWSRLTVNERKVLRAVAEFGSPTVVKAQNNLGLKPGTAQAAADRLVDAGELRRIDSKLSFVDPFMRAWVLEGTGTASHDDATASE